MSAVEMTRGGLSGLAAEPDAEAAGEDALLRAWARILSEAQEADRATRPALRVISSATRTLTSGQNE